MIMQNYFKYHFTEKKDRDNFFVNITNQDAFNVISTPSFDQNVFLFGPKKIW